MPVSVATEECQGADGILYVVDRQTNRSNSVLRGESDTL